jgi:hypothetical protein
MANLEHTPTSTERDMIEGEYEKPKLTQTISSGAVSMSPELFEKVRTHYRHMGAKQTTAPPVVPVTD